MLNTYLSETFLLLNFANVWIWGSNNWYFWYSVIKLFVAPCHDFLLFESVVDVLEYQKSFHKNLPDSLESYFCDFSCTMTTLSGIYLKELYIFFALFNFQFLFVFFQIYFQFSSLDTSGYVGFANLPNQVHRKSVKKGFEFTLMVVGESGLGKSTLVNSLFLTDLYPERVIPDAVGKIYFHEFLIILIQNVSTIPHIQISNFFMVDF